MHRLYQHKMTQRIQNTKQRISLLHTKGTKYEDEGNLNHLLIRIKLMEDLRVQTGITGSEMQLTDIPAEGYKK